MVKKLYSIIVAVCITSTVFSQAPEKFSYQAIVRNSSNVLLTSQAVGVQISILQGSISGPASYVETHAPTTNATGLISLEIGTGSVVSGDFSVIDWGNGPYFLKTETDPTGGASYTISGTSQLMSVPYALHAKTADSIIGGVNYTETDPVFGGSVAFGITALDTANWNSHTIDTNTQLDSTGVANLGFAAVTLYQVGDFAHGGIVFWVDESGQHGLVCAKTDQSSGIQWYNGVNTNTEALGNGVGAGDMNTSLIIANQGNSSILYAAGLSANYTATENSITYADWYLPSKYELNLMYLNKATINSTALANGGTSFSTSYYWCSTESNSGSAGYQLFSNGLQANFLKSTAYDVRSIRYF